jgi:ElaB/YqjD/DUF883 family membrane-anchored ribosome-binding protein
MTDTTTDQRSPEEIEREIRATQAEMSRTVQQIEGEFSPRNIIDALLDKAGQSGVDSDYLIDAARRNPLALGMIAIGGLWLVSDADARPSALGLPMRRSSGKDSQSDWHPEHRNYVEHMPRCERLPDEDDATYRRRRDHSRASYFMIEQGHDEDEGTFRKRLDEAAETLRRGRERMGERAQAFAGQSRERARQATETTRDFYFDNPLLGGLAASFVGAVAGSAVPTTRTEESYVGALGEQALGAVGAKARQAGEQVRHRKDEMLDLVDEQLGSGGQGDAQSQSVQQDNEQDEGGSDRSPRFGQEA